MTSSSKNSKSTTIIASELKWLTDLTELLKESKSRFADVIWSTPEGELIYGNKCIIYSRAAGSFQLKYLNHYNQNNQNSSRNESSRSLPFQPYNPSQRSLSSSHDFHENALFLRTPSSSSGTSINSTTPTINSNSIIPIPLEGTDPATFAGCLEFLYTGAKAAEVFAVLFDGFEEGLTDESDGGISSIARLRQDLLYAWRSKLFADVSLALDDGSRTVFASHRAILASRSPYFQSLLLGNYGDSNRTEFTLPSPPFTPASTVFCLGYIYSGTLEFGDRSFDLNTAFDLWRCGAYLSMESLQSEVEEKILEMLNLKRAARIFQFSSSPDVNSKRLIKSTEPYLIGHFGEVWPCSQIGNLEYSAQRKLVEEVCLAIKPNSVTSIGKSAFSLKKRLELERSSWAGHILSMVEAIEDRLRDVMSRHLSEIVVSSGFVDLIDGVGFSTDVLEWLLELAVGGLTEAKAPEAYQALVGSVLLREEGITMDAKVLVEDAKNGILKYIKRKCVGIRSARGFENLEGWCLKEISDDIEVSIQDLQAVTNRPAVSTSRTGLRITPKRSNGTYTSDSNTSTPPPTSTTIRSTVNPSTTRTPSTMTPRNATSRTVNRTAVGTPSTSTTATSTSTSTSTPSSSTRIPPIPSTNTTTTTNRAPRPMTVSVTSRQSPAVTAAATVIRARSNLRTGSSTAMSRNPSSTGESTSSSTTSTGTGTSVRSPRLAHAAVSGTSNISTPIVQPVASGSRSRTPTASTTRRPSSLAPSTSQRSTNPTATTTTGSATTASRPPNPPFNTSNRTTNISTPSTSSTSSNRIIPKPRASITTNVPFPASRIANTSTTLATSPPVTSASSTAKGKERARINSVASTGSSAVPNSGTSTTTSGSRPASVASTRTINGTRFRSNETTTRPSFSTGTSSTSTNPSTTTIVPKVARSNSVSSNKSTRSASTLGGRIAPRTTGGSISKSVSPPPPPVPSLPLTVPLAYIPATSPPPNSTSNSVINSNLRIIPPTPLSIKSLVSPKEVIDVDIDDDILYSSTSSSLSIDSPLSMDSPTFTSNTIITTATLTSREMNLLPPKEPNSELRRTFSTKTLPTSSPIRVSSPPMPDSPALISPPPLIPFVTASSRTLPPSPPTSISTSLTSSPATKPLTSSNLSLGTPLPGTTLLSGIPCIVTVNNTNQLDRPIRFKAAVRYLGAVLWKGGTGQWVGVEVLESGIPEECRNLEWNDGVVEGVIYFKLTPESISNRSRNISRTTSAAGNYSSTSPNSNEALPSPSLEGSTSSLRPPSNSRRPRRSSSTDGSVIDTNGHQLDGQRKGLFVRPNQIVYVL